VARVVQKNNQYRFLVDVLEGRRLLGSLRHEQEDNIKMSLKVIGLDHVDWRYLAIYNDHWRTFLERQ
jgi:hypothetical protein